MTAYFNLSFEDLLAFQKDVIKTSHTHAIKEQYFKWISAGVLFLLSLLFVNNTLRTFAAVLLLTIVYLFAFPNLYKNLQWRRMKSQMEKIDYSHVLGECKVTISNDGIHREIRGSSTHFKWDDFEKGHDDSERYYLYVSDLQGLIISKTPHNLNPEETAAYNKLIKDYTKKN